MRLICQKDDRITEDVVRYLDVMCRAILTGGLVGMNFQDWNLLSFRNIYGRHHVMQDDRKFTAFYMQYKRQ